MSLREGSFGPGVRRCPVDEKRIRYLRSTNALWSLNRVVGLTYRKPLQAALGIPVVEPTQAAVAMAMGRVTLGWHVS